MLTYKSIARLDYTHNGKTLHIIYNPCTITPQEIKDILDAGHEDSRIIIVNQARADNLFVTAGNTDRLKPDMSFYIGQDGASGIKADNWDAFVGYLYDAYCQAIVEHKTQFDITIES